MAIFEQDPDSKVVKANQEESPRFTLTTEDLKRLGGRFGIYLLAAMVTFVAENLPNIDFGTYTLLVGAVVGLILDAIRRFITDQQYLVSKQV